MLSGAGRTLIILIILIITSAGTEAQKDALDSLTLRPSGEVGGRLRSVSQVRPPSPLHVSSSRLKAKTKLRLENNTGLRKTDVQHSNSLPASDRSMRTAANHPDAILAAPHIHHKGAPDHESNRPRKMSPMETQNSSRAAAITNRHPTSLLHQLSYARREPEAKERTCLPDCHKERDEREAFCHSHFAVNGIVHDVDIVGGGVRLLTVLVNSRGFYKINRLYITADGDFFRITILTVDNPHCPQPSPTLKPGGRYIIMGQIYHRRMALSPVIRRAVSGRIRAGDGLVTSGWSFIRRFTRKKERKVLAAARAKCK